MDLQARKEDMLRRMGEFRLERTLESAHRARRGKSQVGYGEVLEMTLLARMVKSMGKEDVMRTEDYLGITYGLY